MKKTTATASYALLQASLWGFYAILLGYSSNFLYQYNFTDGGISLLLGFSTAASCILQLLLGELSSRFPKVTVYRILLAMGSLIFLGAVLMKWNAAGWMAVAGLGLTCGLLQALPAMGNAIGMDAIAKGSPANYSFARGAGSVSYSLLALWMGRLVSRFGAEVIGLVAAVNALIFLVGVLWFHYAGEVGGQPRESKQEAKAQTPFLRTYPWFALFLVGAICLLASHNLTSNFMLQIINAKGGDASHQGVATFIAAFVEIPVMFTFGLLLRKVGCRFWLCLSVIFFAIKGLLIYCSTGVYGVYGAQATQFAGFGIYAISSVHYAGKAVKREDVVRAQSYLGATIATGSLIASFTGGFLCQWFTAQGLALVAAGLGALGAVIVIPAVLLHDKREETVETV